MTLILGLMLLGVRQCERVCVRVCASVCVCVQGMPVKVCVISDELKSIAER